MTGEMENVPCILQWDKTILEHASVAKTDKNHV